MIAVVFPGQGSQKKGMGGSLFDDFKDLTAKADEILGYSIRALCLQDPGGELGLTQFTQPALFTVNALTCLKRLDETKQRPDYLAGHSSGEYNALFAAGAFDFETGLRLVKKRGELMSRAVGGAMAALIGLGEEEILRLLKQNDLKNITIGNYNSPSQFVLSGLQGDIERAKPLFQAPNIYYIPLNVSAAFHSPYMEKMKQEFSEFLGKFHFSELQIPVISNVTAGPYDHRVKDHLVEQVTHPVRWTDTIRYLMGKGVTHFEEVGPGNVLKGLIRKIQKET